MSLYAITEVWGSDGAPTLAHIEAASAAKACVRFLRSQGYSARETHDGTIVDADAPSVIARRVST